MNEAPDQPTGRSPLRHLGPFARLLLHHFNQDAGVQHVAALTYTTLLSLVPLMTVMLALFSVFPASDRMSQQVEDFLFQNFVPAAGEAVQQHLRNFSQKAGKLTGVGFAFLIIVALMLMSNIDKAFNTIWHVRRKRSPVAKFTVYWAILSLGPILIAFSVGVTSYLVSIPLFSDGETVMLVRTRMLSLMPVLISALAFTLLYALVPNRNVPLRHALAGGVLAALLFELAKRGFALYVTAFPTYETIYGALAAVPIFLIWIYLSWLVTLLGAEFTYCLSIYREDWRESREEWGEAFLLVLRLLRVLRGAQHDGNSLSIRELVRRMPRSNDEEIELALLDLQQARMVTRAEDKGWLLARDLGEVSLFELYRSAPYVLPSPQAVSEEPAALRLLMARLEEDLEANLDQPLASLLSER
ncbi:MAG: virulence factor BrkB family protein [Candidatus Thiodiazotropha sp.]